MIRWSRSQGWLRIRGIAVTRECFVGCYGYMARANALICSEIRSRREAMGYVTYALFDHKAARPVTSPASYISCLLALHFRSVAGRYMGSKVNDLCVTESNPLHPVSGRMLRRVSPSALGQKLTINA
jgi:hypothetical protein